MKKFAIIVAGGVGKRMESDSPKQFLLLSGKPILAHTLDVFHNFSNEIELKVVLPAALMDRWNQLTADHCPDIPIQLVEGGETRFHSVQNGLSVIDGDGIVAVHDGVRCLVSTQTIDNCYQTAEKLGNAVPVISISESIRKTDGAENTFVERSHFKLVQTPQCFHSKMIRQAYQQEYRESFTDDSSVVEALGVKINLVPGNKENIKITTPADLKIAEALIQ